MLYYSHVRACVQAANPRTFHVIIRGAGPAVRANGSHRRLYTCTQGQRCSNNERGRRLIRKCIVEPSATYIMARYKCRFVDKNSARETAVRGAVGKKCEGTGERCPPLWTYVTCDGCRLRGIGEIKKWFALVIYVTFNVISVCTLVQMGAFLG